MPVFDVRYFQPAPELRPYISNYHRISFSGKQNFAVMRAAHPNVSFQIAGRNIFHWPDETVAHDGSFVFGPRCQPVGVTSHGPALTLGIGILPAGWRALFGLSGHELADRMVPLDDVLGPCALELEDRLLNARGDADYVAILDATLPKLMRLDRKQDTAFVALVDGWLFSSGNPSIDMLMRTSELSLRQIERLSQRYFGATPKKLARKKRALVAANKLSLDPSLGWQDVAGEHFYDQTHFNREFKAFIGQSPTGYRETVGHVVAETIRQKLAQGTTKLSIWGVEKT